MSGSKSRIFSAEDAKAIAKRRLPRLVFDFVEGAAGCEIGSQRNESAFDDIFLQPRVMASVSDIDLKTELLGTQYDLPFGIAPMGMCNLICPNADRYIADAAKAHNFPACLSSAGSSSVENMAAWSEGKTWFQLYFGESEAATFAVVDRINDAGYDTLVLTVDVPQVSRRVRDLRNGFNVPFSLTTRSFIDFATHPTWSLKTLAAGIPSPQNFGPKDNKVKFNRNSSRSGADWAFFERLRSRWAGKLIIKGITSEADAIKAQEMGADAIYISTHGGRQLDSVPPSIKILPLIRDAVGHEFPLIFDSGVRQGEDIVKALALGADFVMIGRPILFSLGAEGQLGLSALVNCFEKDIRTTLAQIGAASVQEVNNDVLYLDNKELKDKIEHE